MRSTLSGPALERAGYETRLMTVGPRGSAERSSHSDFAHAVMWVLIVVLLGISCLAFRMLWARLSPPAG